MQNQQPTKTFQMIRPENSLVNYFLSEELRPVILSILDPISDEDYIDFFLE